MFALMLKWNLTVRPDWCNLQTHGLSPVGPLICPIRFPFWVNAFPQTVQTNGFSPVCVLMYSSVCLWPSKCLPQTSQSFIWGKLTSEASRFPWSQNVSPHTPHISASFLPSCACFKKERLAREIPLPVSLRLCFFCPFYHSVHFSSSPHHSHPLYSQHQKGLPQMFSTDFTNICTFFSCVSAHFRKMHLYWKNSATTAFSIWFLFVVAVLWERFFIFFGKIFHSLCKHPYLEFLSEVFLALI